MVLQKYSSIEKPNCSLKNQSYMRCLTVTRVHSSGSGSRSMKSGCTAALISSIGDCQVLFEVSPSVVELDPEARLVRLAPALREASTAEARRIHLGPALGEASTKGIRRTHLALALREASTAEARRVDLGSALRDASTAKVRRVISLGPAASTIPPARNGHACRGPGSRRSCGDCLRPWPRLCRLKCADADLKGRVCGCGRRRSEERGGSAGE